MSSDSTVQHLTRSLTEMDPTFLCPKCGTSVRSSIWTRTYFFYFDCSFLGIGREKEMNIKKEEIPLHVRDQLARSLLRAAETFFSDPDNKKAYEDWLRKRRETA